MVICEYWSTCQKHKAHIRDNMIVEDLDPLEDLISDIAPNRVAYCLKCKQVHLLWERTIVKDGQVFKFSAQYPKVSRPKEAGQ